MTSISISQVAVEVLRPNGTPAKIAAASDSVSIGEGFSTRSTYGKVVSDSVSLDELMLGGFQSGVDLEVSLTVGEAFDPGVYAENQKIYAEDSLSLSESVALRFIRIAPILVSIRLTDTAILQRPPVTREEEAYDVVRAFDILRFVRRPSVFADDSIGVAEALLSQLSLRIADQIRVSEQLQSRAYLRVSLAEEGRLADRVRIATPKIVADAVSITDVMTVVRSIQVTERLRVLDVLAPIAKMGLSFSDRVRMTDAVLRFFAAEANETIGLSAVLAAVKGIPQTISETVGIQDSTARKFLLKMTAAETIRLDDIEALKLMFRPTLMDGIQIDAAYVAPDGGIVTWAVNTITGGVTEYTNFNFNSFARSGNKYLGASSEGLFELNGDDDEGDPIIATMRSGLAQLGGSRFTAFKSAYIGMRGGGDVFLKLVTGDGTETTYKVKTEDMATTKVNLGKGLRARYFAFELTTTGQDFDLDSIEFIPLIANRRV